MSSIDGIVSGINTKDFIANMIKLESAPQTLLQNKKATTDAITKALQAINTKVASLAEFAAKAKKPESLNAVAATVSDSKMAAVTTTESAKPGSLSFTVDQVATSQSSLVKLPDSMGASPSFTLTRDGKDVTITAVTNSLPDIVDAFNAEGTGVKATLITVDDENGAQTQLLQLTSIETGTKNAFTLSSAGNAVELEELAKAGDAKITLFPGSSVQRTRVSSSNTFEDLMTGVNVTVNQVSEAGAKPIQVSVSRDNEATKKLASGLVDNLNAILGDIAQQTKSTNAKASDGADILKPGLLAGNSSIRAIQQSLQSEGAVELNGLVAADLGIVLGRDGTYTFDAAAFDKTVAANPDKAREALADLAGRLGEVAKVNSAPGTGIISQQITSSQETSSDLNARISAWTDRLATRQEALQRQFTAMESMLSKLQGQSSYLTNMISQMNANSSN